MYRKSELSDCRAVYNLICDLECKELPFDKFSEIYEEQINNKNYYCLVCEDDNDIIGVLNLRFEKQLHHSERIAEIMEFVIKSSSRKKGIGKEMLEKACEIAKNAGCVQIEAASNQLRTDTHRFYLREDMNNFHFKFSKSLNGDSGKENKIGR